MTADRQTFDVLSVHVDAVDLPLACARIGQWIQEGRKTYVCVAPVATIMDCQDDAEYRKIINAADMVTPDGIPVVWLGRLGGNKAVQRTYGPDLMLEVCRQGLTKGYRHYLYGGTPEVLGRLESRLKKQFPGINIVGSFSPPFLHSNDNIEKEEVLSAIDRVSPDLLWVALGSPKQDYWLHRHRALLKVPVMVGVGAAFDFHSGAKPQAPRWMQGAGLEWLFRLLSEPRRLWKRYLIGNPRFVVLLVMAGCRRLFRKGAKPQ